MKVSLNAKTNELTITMPANTTNPPKSKTSGKNAIVSSSSGFQTTAVEVNGRPLRINVTAIVAAD